MESDEKLPQLYFNGSATFSLPCQTLYLKKYASRWTLGGDAQLLGFMQNFSDKLVDQMQALKKQTNDLLYNTKVIEVKLNNVFNDFNVLANSQFVENRVYDEDPSVVNQDEGKPKEKELSQQEKDTKILRAMMETVQLCKNAVIDPDRNDAAKKSRYEVRPLPTLLNVWHKTSSEDKLRNKERNHVLSTSCHPVISEIDKTSQASDASDAGGASSSLDSSFKANTSKTSMATGRDMFLDNDDGSDGDLFSEPTIVPGTIAPSADKRLLASSKLDAMFKDRTIKHDLTPSTSSSLASETIAKKKKAKVKSLFDQSDSEEEEDIFKQISDIISKQPGTCQSKSVNSMASQESKEHTALKKEDKLIPIRPSSFSNPSNDSQLRQQHVVVKKFESLFDSNEEDDEEELFLSSKRPVADVAMRNDSKESKAELSKEPNDQPSAKKNIVAKSLFDDDDDDHDDDDIFSNLTRTAFTPSKNGKENEEMEATFAPVLKHFDAPAKKNETMEKVRSIFDDGDDDEFLDVMKKIKKCKNPAKMTHEEPFMPQKVKPIFGDGDDDDEAKDDSFQSLLNSGQNLLAPKPTSSSMISPENVMDGNANSEKKLVSAFGLLLPDDIESSLDSGKAIPSLAKGRKSFFDDDEEEEDDLFSSLSKKKTVNSEEPKELEPARPLEISATTIVDSTVKLEALTKSPISTESLNHNLDHPMFPSTLPEKPMLVSSQKLKGDVISKLQAALSIDPVALGPFSHGRFRKMRDAGEETKEDISRENRDMGVKKPSVGSTNIFMDLEDDRAPLSRNETMRSGEESFFVTHDLDLGTTSTLSCLVKGRPKMPGRRLPTKKLGSDANAGSSSFDFDQKNSNKFANDMNSTNHSAKSGNSPEASIEELFLGDGSPTQNISLPKDIFEHTTLCDTPDIFPPTQRESQSAISCELSGPTFHQPSQSEVDTFFNAKVKKSEDGGSHALPKFNLEPPSLFSDDDDDDDDDDLFSGSKKILKQLDVNSKVGETSRPHKVQEIMTSQAIIPPKYKAAFHFYDGDDGCNDEDLFANIKPAYQKHIPRTSASEVSMQSKSVFDDDSNDEDDLFAEISVPKKGPDTSQLPPLVMSISPEMNPATSGPLFLDLAQNIDLYTLQGVGKTEEEDAEDLFSDKSISKPTKNLKGLTKAIQKQDNLFGDSDDEMFSSLKGTTGGLLSTCRDKGDAPKIEKNKRTKLFHDPLSNL